MHELYARAKALFGLVAAQEFGIEASKGEYTLSTLETRILTMGILPGRDRSFDLATFTQKRRSPNWKLSENLEAVARPFTSPRLMVSSTT